MNFKDRARKRWKRLENDMCNVSELLKGFTICTTPENTRTRGDIIQIVLRISAFLVLIAAAAAPGLSQSGPDLQMFFRQDIGLSQDQIVAIRNGQPVTKNLKSRSPAEVFLFGAVYIHATPESYVQFAHDFERLRKLPNYLALGVFSNPPQASDLKDFSLDGDDIRDLKNCKAGDCQIQIPASSIQEFQRSVDWSAANASQQVNKLLQARALERLLAYQREGNRVLGVYNDKRDAVDVSQQFAYMLGYSSVLPERLPDFNQYLLDYPNAKPANVEDTFYWAKVKFGLKPTLRVVQVVSMRGDPGDEVACAIAEKQLYSSHYFETALDLSFCVRGGDEPAQPGFYLIMVMGSEQAGLTGPKGSIVRKAAVGRSVSSLRNSLTAIRDMLESKPSARLERNASRNLTTEVSFARY